MDILELLFEIARQKPSQKIEIDPFLNLIVIKGSEIEIYDFNKNKLEIADNYSDIILESPSIYGVKDEARIELIRQNDRLIPLNL